MSTHPQDLLVETDWLALHLNDPHIRVVDIRGTIRSVTKPPPWYSASRHEYEQSHIPGAVFVDWLQDIVDLDAPIKATLASPEKFTRVMSNLGIGNTHKVVLYDDDGCHIAARLWWLFKYYGHEQVVLLNGGWSKWIAEKRPVSSTPPSHPQESYLVTKQPKWRADMEDVKRAQRDGKTLLIDNRSALMYRGEATRGKRKGHIPGAVNVPITAMVEGPHQTWRSTEKLQQLFVQAGLKAEQQAITYCNAGVSASVGLFALHLLGHTNATNYDGSWYEWEHNPNNSVVTEE